MLPHASKVNNEQREGKQAVPGKTISAVQNRMGNHQRPAQGDKDGLIDSGILESQFDGYSLTGSRIRLPIPYIVDIQQDMRNFFFCLACRLSKTSKKAFNIVNLAAQTRQSCSLR